jgi:hypothetical protein
MGRRVRYSGAVTLDGFIARPAGFARAMRASCLCVFMAKRNREALHAGYCRVLRVEARFGTSNTQIAAP